MNANSAEAADVATMVPVGPICWRGLLIVSSRSPGSGRHLALLSLASPPLCAPNGQLGAASVPAIPQADIRAERRISRASTMSRSHNK